MSLENSVIFLVVLLFFILFISNFVAMVWFKRNEKSYEQLLSDFRREGLELDTVTNAASFFGVLVCYQKIIYFVRLHKGVKMYRTKDRLVHQKAYEFIQNQPSEKIDWILKLHRFYRFIFILTAIFFFLLILLIKCFR